MIIELVLQQIANGVSSGMVYAIIALGLTLIFGVLRVINFAHGEFYMFGALASVLLTSQLGVPYLITIPVGALMGGLVATVANGIAVRPLLNQPEGESLVLITTFAIGLILHEAVVATIGPAPIPSSGVGNVVMSVGPVTLSLQRLVVVGVGVMLVVAMELMLRRTQFGRSLRAVSQSVFAARVVGLDVGKIRSITFFLAGSLAGMAGALVVPITTFSSVMGEHAIINAFVIVVIGSMGNVSGALVCGLALGIIEALSSIVLQPEIASAIIYSALILMLLVRPRGLFARA